MVTAETERRLEALFAPDDRDQARTLLIEQCGNNLPFLKTADPEGLERVRFAVLRLSEGDLSKLRDAIRLAQTDWRDLLCSAGFAHNANAHRAWLA